MTLSKFDAFDTGNFTVVPEIAFWMRAILSMSSDHELFKRRVP